SVKLGGESFCAPVKLGANLWGTNVNTAWRTSQCGKYNIKSDRTLYISKSIFICNLLIFDE
ncbi:hypothetical protein, partial [Bacteroides nordii]|uniref:hypothetical protein n=1 Tax=Bacteroides nordii TaxID=291645 RepID=UPI001E46AC8D